MSGERRHWLAIGLTLSVFLNLFLAGVVVGRWTPPPLFGAGVRGEAAVNLRAHIRGLPIVERIAFAAVMRRHATEIRADREAVRQAKEDAAAAMAQPVYNRALFEARLAAVRKGTLAQQTAVHEALADAMAILSPKSRITLANEVKSDAERAP